MLYYMLIISGGCKMDFNQIEIADGVSFVGIDAKQFKTNNISMCFALDLKEETVSANAVLVSLLARKCEKYNTLTSFNRKLANLYGAVASGVTIKQGASQVLRLGIKCLDDRFSLDGESISLECAKLLCDMAFSPCMENGSFLEADVEAEKRIIIQRIEAEENEKRKYAMNRAEEIMFSGEPYGIGRLGTKEQVAALCVEDINEAWRRVLSTAKIMIASVGSLDGEEFCNFIKPRLAEIDRNYTPLKKPVLVPFANSVKEEMERQDVKQGKLVLGFRVNMEYDDDLTVAMRCFADIFGGGPYSKLFVNVREKLSLCYYCSARYNRTNSAVMVQSGCNEENMDKAVKEILNQLEKIKSGDFDEEFSASKIAISDFLGSVKDDPETMSLWYQTQIIDDSIRSPEDDIKIHNAVTKEQILKCASLVSLDTVYKLSSPEEAE